MEKILVLLCLVSLGATKPGFRFGTNYGNTLSFIPSSVFSGTPAPHTAFSGNQASHIVYSATPAPHTVYSATSAPHSLFSATSAPHTVLHSSPNKQYRTAAPIFVSTTPAPRPSAYQFVRPGTYFGQTRRPYSPSRISESLFSVPVEGFVSSTSSPTFGGFGGSEFGSTVAPPVNVVPVESFNGNPFPVEISNPGFGGITNVGTSVFEAPDDTPEVQKHFYIHSAPEEPEELVHKHVTIGKPQKTYRVVFIKAPSSNGQAQLSASFAPKEEKTVIYVLSKKPNQVEIKDIITPPPTEPSKPEVIFVKYKTNEEALHAQQTIQAQYDQLGGSSKVNDEGLAPVTSVVGILGGQAQGNSPRENLEEETALSENLRSENEVIPDPVIQVTPTPLSAISSYPYRQYYKVLESRSAE